MGGFGAISYLTSCVINAIRQFVTDFQDAYGSIPGIIEAVAYDSAMIVFRTMRRTATDSRRDLKQALFQMDAFDGVTGQTRFAANGEADKTMQMLQIQRGRFVEVKWRTDAEPVPDQQ